MASSEYVFDDTRDNSELVRLRAIEPTEDYRSSFCPLIIEGVT